VIVHWDTSALVKLLRTEPGSGLAGELWHAGLTGASSTLAVAEVASALARSTAAGDLDEAGSVTAWARWRHIADRLVLMDVDRARADLAAELLPGANLSSADAIHLATATEILRTGVAVTLATWDRRLHAAAQRHGLGVVPAAV
jgi:predicted nucleic acid-binding protein